MFKIKIEIFYLSKGRTSGKTVVMATTQQVSFSFVLYISSVKFEKHHSNIEILFIHYFVVLVPQLILSSLLLIPGFHNTKSINISKTKKIFQKVK